MGIRPYKAFTYDGKSSLDYGVYLTGEGVFNAPERAVEMIEIPGRNGNFALDQGRFQNISVTYKAGLVDYSESNFATRMSNVRNWLCSKVGYRRLEDDYNTGEYRMAVYLSGIEVEHEDLQTGEFEITFDCKPQRFLTSGETAVSVVSGGTITNPTLFDAKPQLQVKGYGNIDIGGEDIDVENVPLGLIKVGNGITRNVSSYSGNYSQGINLTDVLTGDSIYSNGKTIDFSFQISSTAGPYTSFSITSMTKCSASVVFGNYSATVSVTMDDCTFEKGTSLTEEATVDFSFVHKGTTSTGTATIRTIYSSGTTLNHYVSVTNYNYMSETFSMKVPTAYADSTKTATGNPLYIDLEIGEAWNEDGGEPLSLNNAVQMPSKLPTLKSGANTITYDNTFTSFKVVPRWWRV